MRKHKILRIFIVLSLLFLMTACESDATVRNKAQKTSGGVGEVLRQGIAENDAVTASEAEPESSVSVTSGDYISDESISFADVNDSRIIDPAYAGSGPADDDEFENMLRSAEEGVDLDLTALSSTMVYSEVFYMMVMPENYIGKTIKMSGAYVEYYDDTTDKTYFACIIQDATACCSQGMEFVLTDDYSYPEDYPKEGSEVCVIGVFETYDEGEETYCRLKDARIV